MAAARPEKPRIGCLAVTGGGQRLAADIAAELSNAEVIPQRTGLANLLPSLWPEYDGFVFVMAAGIVVRLIAPLLKDKKNDPGVVVVDEAGRFAISLVSGHLGGANELARQVAKVTGGQSVITTASDTLGHTALDLWARDHGLAVTDNAALTRASAKLVNSGNLSLYSEVTVATLPEDFVLVNAPDAADCIVSHGLGPWPEGVLLLQPRDLVVGIGCNRGTTAEQIDQAISEAFAAHNLAQGAIRNLASIDLKADEGGLLAVAKSRNLTIDFYDKDALNGVAGISTSQAALRATGAKGVAEPAALLSAGTDNLLVRKMKWKDVTLAVAQAPCTLSAPAPEG